MDKKYVGEYIVITTSGVKIDHDLKFLGRRCNSATASWYGTSPKEEMGRNLGCDEIRQHMQSDELYASQSK
ncbi:unnamed protein product [Acanthoscelides obtectus]|uniref:Uncharacterized protein n=1 Tax=Acanthoscelides obtectus TaxID=200917 RepID=A0A9P0QHE6_ACAOB|nr:unnamed protein product [Acanthoscelides obtectus]CAK1683591.1 hypothetical protein AOBTE_LOCUS34345 [Acanthoscelides obtectus]